MSDISTKLTYLSTTKSQLKDMINYGLPTESQITSSTTFRNYVSSIFEAFLESLRNPDTLFNNLPKTTGTGTQITLNNTANAPMRIELNPTAISQDGTPTPDNPQDIHTISGNNSVVVEGKNLLPFTNQDFTLKNVRYYVQNGSIILNGTSTGETSSVSADFKNNFSFWLDAGTYTFSIKSGRATRLPTYILKYSDNSSLGAINGYNSSSASFTLNEKTQVYIGFYVYQQTFTNDSPELQLEKGSTATTYTPYVSQTTPINLGEYELGTIGNYKNRIFKNVSGDSDYSSERDEGSWYYKQGIGKIVLDGSETWTDSGKAIFTNITNAYCLSNKDNAVINGTIDYIYCDNFSIVGLLPMYSDGAIGVNLFYVNTPTNIRLAFGFGNISINDFKNWLNTHNTIVYYQLATPTYTKITGTLETQLENIYKNMLSYDNQTNISQINNDLPFTLDVSAIEVQ